MDTKGKEAILRRIENEKVCGRGRLTCFCSVTAAQLDQAAKELEAEGKIVAWPKGRSTLYTPAGAPDPRPAGSNDATVASKKPRRVNQSAKSAATPPIKKGAKRKAVRPSMTAPREAGPSNGGDGAYAAAIADLSERKDVHLAIIGKIDHAIEVLRSLA